MKTLKKKMEFLAKKLSSLQAELKVSKDIFEEATAEVKNLFLEKHPQPKESETPNKEITKPEDKTAHHDCLDPQSPPEDCTRDVESVEVSDPEVKKLFKKIALQCHPDKIATLLSEEEKARKKEIYIRARRALEENDLILLSACAAELKIEIPEVTTAHLREAEKKINTIKKERVKKRLNR